MHAMQGQVRRATERADAMEAASALLQSEEMSPTSQPRAGLGFVDENVVGARSVLGSVVLTHVPELNGGAPSTARQQPGRQSSGGHRRFSFSSPLDPPAAAKANGADHKGESAPTVVHGRPLQQRKMSFSKKAGRKLVRSLSFGHDAPKREWGSAAS